jgi:hypothetical protein
MLLNCLIGEICGQLRFSSLTIHEKGAAKATPSFFGVTARYVNQVNL